MIVSAIVLFIIVITFIVFVSFYDYNFHSWKIGFQSTKIIHKDNRISLPNVLVASVAIFYFEFKFI